MTASNPMGNRARNPSAHLPHPHVYPDQDTSPAQPEQERFLRLPEVKQVTGLSKTVLYGLIQDDAFPAPYRIALKASGWKYSEIMQWMESRPRVGGDA